MILRLVFGLFALLGVQGAFAQQPDCRFFKVQSNSANVSKEPRGDAAYIDQLNNADIVCVTREQRVGERDWAFVAHKVVKPDQRTPIEGWVNLRSLERLSDAESAALRGGAPPPAVAAVPPPAAAPPPAAPAPAAAAPTEETIIKFNEPITFGPYPVNGSSLEQLFNSVPMFPPIEGLAESIWKRPCSSCHKWDRRTLCEQGATYVKNPPSSLRHPHPFGGADKLALMQWAKTGCQ
jgi:hypothetical protein